MDSKKGDIWKFKDPKSRGLSPNVYFYCRGSLDEDVILVRCLITQNGEIEILNEIDDYKDYEDDLVKISLEEFLNDKYNFELATCVEINHKIFSDGIIREIYPSNRKLLIEVEDDDTCEYKEIKVDYDDILIVYPEFAFNKRRQFKKI